MKNVMLKARNLGERYLPVVACGAAALAVAGPSWATDPTPPDLTTGVNAASSTFTTMLTTNAPAIFGILALAAGVAWVFRSGRKAMRGA